MNIQIIIFVVLSLLSINTAYTAGVIDSIDINNNANDWRTVAMCIGALSSISIKYSASKDLILFAGMTENVETISKWLFRIAVFFLLLPLFTWIDSYLGWQLLTIWSVLRACQALFLSGVELGVKNSDSIRKKLNEPRNLD